MIKLKPRLAEIVKLLKPPISGSLPSAVCDVGTDHGHIPIWLVQNGATRVIATDISAPSAEKARINALVHGFSDRIEVRVGNGLEPLGKGEADAIIIAGMGGLLISEIMVSGKNCGAKTFILQPMGAVYELRKWLYENGYKITYESIAREKDKLYNILRVEQGTAGFQSRAELYIGKHLIEHGHPLILVLLEREIYTLNKKISALTGANRPVDEETIEIFNALKEWYNAYSE